MVPLQFAAAYPRFLTNEPCLVNGKAHWPLHSQTLERDRRFYVECIKKIVLSKGGIAQDYYEMLAREDKVQRYWWLSAVGRVDIMRAIRYFNFSTSTDLAPMMVKE